MTLAMTIAVVGHVIGAVLGVGGVTVNDLALLRAIGDGDLGVAYQKSARTYSAIIWLGWLLLAGSALYLALTNDWVLRSPRMQVKIALFSLLTLNGLVMGAVLIPRLHRLTRSDWQDKSTALRQFVLLGVFPGALSLASWYTVLILGAAGRQPWTVTQMLTGFVVFLVLAWIGAASVVRWRLKTPTL